MTDDLLARAEALREDLEDGDDDYADEREIIAELIAEIKRLKSFADDLMGNCNILRSRAQNAEAQIQRLGALAFMKNLPADQIIDHFISWGNAAYEDQKQQAAYVTRLEAAYLAAETEKRKYEKAHPNPFFDSKMEYWSEREAREALERIKGGEQE